MAFYSFFVVYGEGVATFAFLDKCCEHYFHITNCDCIGRRLWLSLGNVGVHIFLVFVIIVYMVSNSSVNFT